MRFLIWHKLFFALLAGTALVLTLTLLLTRWSFNRGFLDYINVLEAQRIESMAEDLAGIYAETDSWDDLLQNRRRWRRVMSDYARGARKRPAREPEDAPPAAGEPLPEIAMKMFVGQETKTAEDPPIPIRPIPPARPLPPPGPLGVRQPIDLLDDSFNTLIGDPDQPANALLKAIEVRGITVGYLRYLPVSALTELDEAAERDFVTQQREALLGTGFLALIIAAGIAVALGRQLVKPVRSLVTGTHLLASGQLEQRIPVSTQDELGMLAEDFNEMASSLEQNQRSQRQWVADIAHELRTPLAILNGELQAVEDGVRKWDQSARQSLQAETDRLTGLVNDLRELTLSDAGGLDYQWKDIDLSGIIEDTLDSYRTRITESDLTVETDIPEGEIPMRGDARRLQQLISNLLENCCRYTDPGGRIRVSCSNGDSWKLTIEDTAPAVPDDSLPRLFDRLYRVDESRQRGTGGSGLGLSICKGIVETHGGSITAAHSPLGGLAIKVVFPRDSA